MSAMNLTPQKAITSASVSAAFLRQLEAVADEIGQVLQFGLLVVMREDDRVALLAQPVDLGAQVECRQGWSAGRSFKFPVAWLRHAYRDNR